MNRQYTFLAVLLAATASSAYADLQNVEVGGSIRIRGNYYNFDSLGDMSWIDRKSVV